MKLDRIRIEGFGIWSGLTIESLDAGLNVLYGRNEAGKSTLLQFLRSIFYGFSTERQTYLPPRFGGRPGGWVEVGGPAGTFQIARYAEPTGDTHGEIAILGADGTRQGEHVLGTILSGIDEATFNNVFAVGLTELQELATLGDTEASELLYAMSAGLDRVSLVEVMRQLEASRLRIFAEGDDCQMRELLAERAQLQARIEELGQVAQQYGRLAAEQGQVDRDIAQLEEESTQAAAQAQVVDLAIALAERWRQRAELDQQITLLGEPKPVSEAATKRLGTLNAVIGRRQDQLDQLKQSQAQLRSQLSDWKLNRAVWRQAAAIEVLGQQQSWIRSLEESIAALEKERSGLEAELAAEHRRLGLDESAAATATPISARLVATLRPLGQAADHQRRRLDDARKKAADARQTADALQHDLEAGLAAQGQPDLAPALERIGGELSRLRRRLQLDERLAEMAAHQAEVESQSRQILNRQLLPGWVLLGLVGMSMLGMVLLALGLLLPASITGSLGWAMAVMGLLGAIAGGLTKVVLDRSNTQRLDTCRKQLALLESQTKQAIEERDALDRQLSGSGLPLGSRLEKSQQQLAALEELVPLDGRRQAARDDAGLAERRVDQAKADRAAAVRRWREALAAAGLPERLTPRGLRLLIRSADSMAQLRRRLDTCREELQRRRSEWDSLAARVGQLAADAGLVPGTTAPAAPAPVEPAVGPGTVPIFVAGGYKNGTVPFRGANDISNGTGACPLTQLQALGEALAAEKATAQRRETVRRRLRQLRRKRVKHEHALERLKARRLALLRRAGARNEDEFRQRALDYARARLLRQQRDAIAQEIVATIAGRCPEEAIGAFLRGDADGTQSEAGHSSTLDSQLSTLNSQPSTLDSQLSTLNSQPSTLNSQLSTLNSQLSTLNSQLSTLNSQLQERFEQRGRLAEQQKALAEDRRLAEAQLERGALEQRIEEAIHRWRVLAVTNRILDSIRAVYQTERQPETLQEASRYLEQLTQGRYRRVWTPLGEQVLRVDDHAGKTLAVDSLSRGTREQLFLALRLALAGWYARHGAALPLVLDDVLVNFDADRARAAATVLGEFAEAGHQVLIFTCHEHLLKLLRSLHASATCLPESGEPGPAAPIPEPPARPRNRRRPPEKPADSGPTAPPADEPSNGHRDEFDEAPWEAEPVK